MKSKLLIGAAALALMASPALAQSEHDNAAAGGAVGGAIGGAAVGAVVGGPVGAAVGGVIGAAGGATTGAALTPPPPEVVTYVRQQDVPSVSVDEDVKVGEPLPHVVRLYPVPRHDTYDYAVVNNEPVIVEHRSRRIVRVVRAEDDVGRASVDAPVVHDDVTGYVVNWEVPSVTVEHHVTVGQPLPRTVTLYPVPHHDSYDYTVVNHRRVFVDPHTRRVVRIIRTEDDDGD